jgi:hypothetical protein
MKKTPSTLSKIHNPLICKHFGFLQRFQNGQMHGDNGGSGVRVAGWLLQRKNSFLKISKVFENPPWEVEIFVSVCK